MANGSRPRKQRRGCRGCLGCLLSLVFLGLALVALWFLGPILLRAAGILPPDAEELFSGAPDPLYSEEVTVALDEAGIEGARAVVLPTKGRNRQLAVVTFDDSSMVRGTGPAAAEEAFMKAIGGVSRASRNGANLDRAVVDIRDGNGKPLIAMTASQTVIDAFVDGEIDRRAFLREVDADLSNLLNLTDVESATGSASGPGAEFFAELAIEWTVEKRLITVDCPAPYNSEDCNFGVNIAEIARWKAEQNALVGGAMGLFGVRRMDSDAANALDAVDVVVKLERAVSLADEGLIEGDLDKINEAIDLRPDDWSLHDRKGALLLAQGNTEAAEEAFREAESVVARRTRGEENCKALRLNLARNRQRVLDKQSQRFATNESLRRQLEMTQDQVDSLENDRDDSPCR